MNCDSRTYESFHEHQSCIRCTTNFISDETFDEKIVVGDVNCDLDNGRFVSKFMSMTTL